MRQIRSDNVPRIVLSCLAVLALLSASAQAQEKYDLRKTPAMEVGRSFSVIASGRTATSVSSEGKTVRQSVQTVESSFRQQVIEQAGGSPRGLLHELTSHSRRYQVSLPVEEALDKTIELRNVSGLASADKSAWSADTQSLASTHHESLTAQQLAAVKAIFSQRMRLEASPAAERALMPPEPVAVGASWKPAGDDLAAWLAASGMLSQVGGSVKEASFSLDSVRQGVATVKGRLVLEVDAGPVKFRPAMDLVFRIETASGVWRGKAMSMADRFEANGAVVTISNEATTVVTDLGARPVATTQPATAPAAHRLGWQRPGPDNNSHKNPAMGVSINLPEGFTAATDESSDAVLTFHSPAGVRLVITAAENEAMYDMVELTKAVLANLTQTVPQYKLIERKDMTLADNVPAHLFQASCMDGRAVVLTLVANDGARLVNVTAGVPAERADLLKQALEMVKTLRVSEPALKTGK